MSLVVGAFMRGSKGKGEVVVPAAVLAALAGVERVESWLAAMSQVPGAGPT